jgi:hypothetical protein
MKESFGIPVTDFTTFDDENGNIVIGTGMSFNKSIITKLSEVAKEKLSEKRKMEEEQSNNEDENETSIDLSDFKRKPNSKKSNVNKKPVKDLSAILNKYRNIK